MPTPNVEQARQTLAHRWLSRFGPATVEDLRWWTGWNKTDVRHALHHLPVEEVDLHGTAGIALAADDVHQDHDHRGDARPEPVATLLPALDPTPMGWKQRGWLLGIDEHHVFDRAGNISPTLWWDGEIIGSWTVTATGDIRAAIVADRGAEAGRAIEAAATRLHDRLEGSAVTPAIRTPLERSLRVGDPAGPAP